MGPMLAILLGRVLNRDQAYRLADWMAEKVALRKDSALIRAVRSNQAVVRGLDIDSPALDEAVREVFHSTARGYADWYRAMAGGPEEVLSSVEIDGHLVEELQGIVESGRGVIIAGAHISSFNLLLLALGVQGYPVQALSHPDVQGAMHVDNAVRRKFGLDVTPINYHSLRQAMRRLKKGGVVVFGVDRPDVGGDELTFFGRKVELPIGHARMAFRTDSIVLVGMMETLGPGKYQTVHSQIIEPKPTGNFHQDVRDLAQQLLERIEMQIRAHPGEWSMFLPVWPDNMPTWQGD